MNFNFASMGTISQIILTFNVLCLPLNMLQVRIIYCIAVTAIRRRRILAFPPFTWAVVSTAAFFLVFRRLGDLRSSCSARYRRAEYRRVRIPAVRRFRDRPARNRAPFRPSTARSYRSRSRFPENRRCDSACAKCALSRRRRGGASGRRGTRSIRPSTTQCRRRICASRRRCAAGRTRRCTSKAAPACRARQGAAP